jgi:hypothetical protein
LGHITLQLSGKYLDTVVTFLGFVFRIRLAGKAVQRTDNLFYTPGVRRVTAVALQQGLDVSQIDSGFGPMFHKTVA